MRHGRNQIPTIVNTMDETQRTKLLGGILLAVLGFMAIRPDQKLFEPIKDAQRLLGNAEEDLEREEMKRMELLVARENIGRGRATGGKRARSADTMCAWGSGDPAAPSAPGEPPISVLARHE